MTNLFDLGDEVGRQNLAQLVEDILLSSHCLLSFGAPLVTVLSRVETNLKLRIEKVAEIISELRDPISCSLEEAVSLSRRTVEGEVRSPAKETEVTLLCLRLVVSALQDPAITGLDPTLLSLMEEFVTLSVQSEAPEVRREAVTALACCCLRSLPAARQHMLLFLQVGCLGL